MSYGKLGLRIILWTKKKPASQKQIN